MKNKVELMDFIRKNMKAVIAIAVVIICLLYTSDAADEL